MGNEKKSAQLGMPFGTACNKLRKLVLFGVLKKHGENVCIRCNELIESVDDLSLEHIKPWEDRSVVLFWDLDNVAFSHVHCNVPHTYLGSNGKCRKTGPEGTSWCAGHKQFLSKDSFWKNRTRWDGVQEYCKDCQNSLKRINSAEECHSYKVEAQSSNL